MVSEVRYSTERNEWQKLCFLIIVNKYIGLSLCQLVKNCTVLLGNVGLGPSRDQCGLLVEGAQFSHVK